MKKPLLVTNIDDLLIKHKAFVEPHKAWFQRVIKKGVDPSIKKWMGKKDYFLGVKEAMSQLMPNATTKQQNSKAREWYQQDVVNYIKSHPRCVNRKVAKSLEALREDYTIVLVTTNTEEYIHKILKSANLTKIYHGIVASKTSEAPNKSQLIKTLVKEYGKPSYYLTAKKEPEVDAQFKKIGTRVISPSRLEKL